MKERHIHYSKSRKYAELLDSRFTIPGTTIRFGIDPLFGLVSGVGDVIGAVFSTYFLWYATKLGAGSSVLLRMFVNILAEMIIGSIPILGDMFDVVWKANLRNLKLLEKLEKNPVKLEGRSKGLMWLLFIILAIILIALVIAILWIIGAVLSALFN